MRNFTNLIRSTTRQLVILTALAGLTFAAGIQWAEAAEAGSRAATANAMPSEIHVVFLFLVTLGALAVVLSRPQERVKVRGRADKRRARRR